MTNIKLLLKIMFLNLFQINRIKHNNNPKEKRKLRAFFMGAGILVIYIVAIMYFYLSFLAPVLAAQNAMDGFLGLLFILVSIIVIFTTIYKAVGTVVGTKDYELLIALPIKRSDILISKWLWLYLTNFGFTLLVFIPGILLYQSYVDVSVLFYLFVIIGVVCVPIIPIIIGCSIGIVIRFLANRFRYSNMIAIVLIMVMTVMYLYYVFTLTPENEMDLLISNSIIQMLQQIYPLASIFTKALHNQNIVMLISFVLVSGISFIVFVMLIGKNYVTLQGVLLQTKTKGNYILQKSETRSVWMALLQRERQRYFSSITYVVNTAMGPVLQTLGIVYCITLGYSQIVEIVQLLHLEALIPVAVIGYICITSGLTTSSSSSVSLEGKQLWILKSLPVSAKEIFQVKIVWNILIFLPLAIINSILVAVAFSLSILQLIGVISIGSLFILWMSQLGLLLNLQFPTFDWIDEAKVIKQGMPILIQMFVGIISAIIVVGVLLFNQTVWIYGALAMVLIGINYWIHRYLKANGEKIFLQL